jgi:glycosyltransferase involved in cell wall biosynthesis
MRILYCIPTLRGGGAERQVRLLTKEFGRRGIGIGVLSRFDKQDLEELGGDGIHCVPIVLGNHDPRLPLKVAREAGMGGWDIVQSWIAQMDVLVGLCAPICRFRWILSERSAPIHYARGWKNALRKRLGARADLVIANSASGLSYWGDEPVPKMVIPNALDLDSLRATRSEAALTKIGDTPLVVSIGRFDQWKNFSTLIEALAVLRDRGRFVRLAILGDGPMRPELEQLVAALKLADRVELPGFVSDVTQWLARADLFASASLYEGQPNAVLEAAAAGVPTVLSRIQEHLELMDNAALFADAHDPRDFAGGIARMIDDRATASALAQAAYAQVKRQSVEAVASRYIESYQQLLRAGGR